MKLIGSNEEYFRAVATPNREKPKEKEEVLIDDIQRKPKSPRCKVSTPCTV